MPLQGRRRSRSASTPVLHRAARRDGERPRSRSSSAASSTRALVRPADGKRLPRRRHADAHLSLGCAAARASSARLRATSGAISSRCVARAAPRGSTSSATTGRARRTCSRRSTSWRRCARSARATPRSWSRFGRRRGRGSARAWSKRGLRARARGRARRRARRCVQLDGKRCARPRGYFGGFNVVLFVPEDLLLPRAAAGGAAAVPRPRGVQRASRLSRARRRPTRRCCKQPQRGAASGGARPSRTLLEVYDEELAAPGARGRCAGARSSPSWRRAARGASSALHGDLPVELALPQRRRGRRGRRRGSVRAALLRGLARAAALDERAALHRFGPHTDDLAIELGGRLARSTPRRASCARSCWRSSSPSSRTSSARLGDPPVLLLDDVPSELDPTRRAFLFDHARGSLARRSSRSPTATSFPPAATDAISGSGRSRDRRTMRD